MKKNHYLSILLASIMSTAMCIGFSSCKDDETENPATKSYLNCPDNNHPHLIDLGLPSGTKWACCNVGADKPEAFGGYYAWGETEEKSTYDWANYIHCDGSEETCHDIGSSIAGTQYDVAHVKWGGSWQMPTTEQCLELQSKCTNNWITINGVNGHKFTGKNGSSIFLPAAGLHKGSDFNQAGDIGHYWLGSQCFGSPGYSYHLYIDWGIVTHPISERHCLGFSVRPVAK